MMQQKEIGEWDTGYAALLRMAHLLQKSAVAFSESSSQHITVKLPFGRSRSAATCRMRGTRLSVSDVAPMAGPTERDQGSTAEK